MPESANGIWATTRRECARITSDRLYPLLMIVLPLTSFGILWAIFHQQVPRNLPAAACDLDASRLSRQVIRMIHATPTMDVLFHVSNPEEGRKLLLEGKVYALVLLPRSLEKDAKRGNAAEILGYYNAQWLLAGSLVYRDLTAVVGTASAALDLRSRRLRGEMYAAARARVEPIRVETHALFNPQFNYLYFLLTTLLPTMLQIFVLVLAVHSIGVELKEGTARAWLQTAGNSVWRALAGKLLPYTANFLILAMFVLSFLFRYLGVPERGNLLLLGVGTVLFVLAYQAMGVFLVSVTANLRLATSLTAFYAGAAFAFTGVTFPTMAMPFTGKAWGEMLPLTHYLRLIVQQGLQGVPRSSSLEALGALFAFVLLPPLLSQKRMARLLRQDRYWGRT